MKRTSLPTIEPLTTADVNQRAYQLLYMLDAETFKDLAAFSAYQLSVGCRHRGAARELLLKEGADLLHDAFETVLAGLREPSGGRHPRAADVRDLGTFLRYLRTVIRSIRYRQAATAAAAATVVEVTPTAEVLTVQATVKPEEDAELRDFKEAFFVALRHEQDDPAQYAVVLETWRQEFFTLERLTELGLSPKDAWKLRSKAQRLYHRLSNEGSSEPIPVDAW